MGTLRTLSWTAVMISTVAVMPGFRRSCASLTRTVTRKFVTSSCVPAMLVIPEFPTSVTTALSVVSASASTSISAPCPILTSTMSVSSISTSTSMSERSERVMMTVPGAFIVPVTTFSPSSTLRRVTTPSIGEWNTVLSSWSSAARSAALAS